MENKEKKSYTAYLNYGFQFAGGVAIGIFGGNWLDKKLAFHTPLLIWILPLIILAVLLYQTVKEFSGKNKDDK